MEVEWVEEDGAYTATTDDAFMCVERDAEWWRWTIIHVTKMQSGVTLTRGGAKRTAQQNLRAIEARRCDRRVMEVKRG